jgi:hypothetical protein
MIMIRAALTLLAIAALAAIDARRSVAEVYLGVSAIPGSARLVPSRHSSNA